MTKTGVAHILIAVPWLWAVIWLVIGYNSAHWDVADVMMSGTILSAVEVTAQIMILQEGI